MQRMRYGIPSMLLVLLLAGGGCAAQTAGAAPGNARTNRAANPAGTARGVKAGTRATAKVPPFAGTWLMNNQRSKLMNPIRGESRATIEYDGKTWHYIHSHLESPDDLPEEWQTTLIVDSPKFKTVLSEDIVFHERLIRQGDSLLLIERGETVNGQRFHSTVHYTLTDNGNTLIEAETLYGPLGPERNLYVLERQPESGPAKP